MVTVEVFGSLREEVEQNVLELSLSENATVADAIAAAGLDDRVDLWVLLDGRRAARDRPLSQGSRLTFFQPTGGG